MRRTRRELYLEELVEFPLQSTVALRETLPSKKEKEETCGSLRVRTENMIF
jgi:hypothetical protein